MRLHTRDFFGLALIAVALGFPLGAQADVVVLANRTGVPMPIQVSTRSAPAQSLTLPADESLPIFVDGPTSVAFHSQGGAKQYGLTPNCAYYFGRTADGRVDLQQIGLGEDDSTASGRKLPGSASRTPSATIPVKIVVDEEEPARRTFWERRLRHRVEAASKILDKHCRVRLQVVAAETWNSGNATSDFFQSLAEFEREVDPSPARLAIGFTSQFQLLRGRVHLAGTRGPLHSHILLREFSPKISEPERLELLVHELGHHLGASHSPEPISVMRPVLGDDLAGRSDFAIRFDPVNTLTMSIIGEEIRRRKIRQLADMTPGSKHRLRQIYGHLSKTLPDDPAGGHFIRLMDGAIAVGGSAAGASTAKLTAGVKRVLGELRRAAEANNALKYAELSPTANVGDGATAIRATPTSDTPTSAATPGAKHLEGDALMEHYVRKAASAAQQLPADVGPKAFLLALGIAMDDTGALLAVPQSGLVAQAAETASERASRLGRFGEPTMMGREDLAKHFAVSACLTALVGVEGARSAGITKEMLDAQMSSGFSFADMAANQAGITFADRLMNKRLTLRMIAGGFRVPLVMPKLDGLAEGLSAAEIKKQFGGKDDPRFRQQLVKIEQRVLRLPPYRAITGTATR